MSYEEFAKHFEGWSAEQLKDGLEFVKLYKKADTDTREAIGEVLEACADGLSLTEAIDGISNDETRARWIEHATEIGTYEKTA